MSTSYFTPSSAVPGDIETREGYRSIWCCFDKGYSSPPFKIVEDEESGTIQVQFELTPFSQTCRCNISCTTQALVFDETQDSENPTQVGQFCPADKQFKVTLSDLIFSEDEPTELVFSFEDARGNSSSLKITSLKTVVPRPPLVVVKDEGGELRVEVGVPLYSRTFVDLRDAVVQYQVERYVGSPSNRSLFVDWMDKNRWDGTHWDRALRSGTIYGYRVRFRSAFDSSSPWSSWTVVTAEGES